MHYDCEHILIDVYAFLRNTIRPYNTIKCNYFAESPVTNHNTAKICLLSGYLNTGVYFYNVIVVKINSVNLLL